MAIAMSKPEGCFYSIPQADEEFSTKKEVNDSIGDLSDIDSDILALLSESDDVNIVNIINAIYTALTAESTPTT